jgi:phosphatidylethanolamine/phosphatidyl-N-methylethanolamine N-methyltransferase
MADQIPAITPSEYIVELGPGTGVVTKALARKGIPMQQLVVVEREQKFLGKLKHEFPHALIVQGDACHLKDILHKHGIKQVAAVVSSLPLLGMPDHIRHTILNTAFEVLKPTGVFIQFTYGLLSPVPETHQRSIGIRGDIAKKIWRNFPPARVWRYMSEKAA